MRTTEQFPPISLTEELILLMLDERIGYIEMGPGWGFSCVMAGAVLADLALGRRTDSDLENLHLIDSTPTGETLLDQTLKEISELQGTRDMQYWIERIAGRSDEIVVAAFDRLKDKGVLDYQNGGFWALSRSVSRSGIYPTSGDESLQESKARVMGVILNDVIPDPRDAILVALMHTVGGFKQVFSPEEFQERLDRIEFVAKLDLIGRTVAHAVSDCAGRPRPHGAVKSKAIPKLGYLDMLRQRDLLSGNIPKGMHEIYRKYGSVVKLPFKIHKSPVVAVIGADVNQWVNKHGRFYLRSKDYVQGLERAVGACHSIAGMDGAEHFRMRREMQHAYSGASFRNRLHEAIHYCRQSLSQWKQGDVFGATKCLEKHISSQSSHLLVNVDCSHYAEELIAFEHRALSTEVQGTLPHFMLSTPRMKRYRKRVSELHEAVMSSHTPAQRRGKPTDIADAALALHKKDPQFLPETDLTFWFVFSMAAAIYLGSGLGFAIYCMIRRPDLYAKVYQEAEAIFGNGRDPDPEAFKHEKFDVTSRLCMESARLYPTFPIQLRMVMNECVVNGFQVPARTILMICQGATHYDPDLFKDPQRIDIDRYLPDRAEHLKPGAYVRFGLGTHACLGRNWAELQMALNMLLIAYHVRLETVPADQEMKIKPYPTSSPSKKMKFRVAEIMNPI